MSCADVQTIQAGNGSKTQFSFDFPYLFKTEIEVSFWNATTKEWDVKATTDATYPWRVTDANPTIVEFTSTAPPSPATPVDPNESSVDNVRIRRTTSIDDIRALFSPGSAIRSDDLNKNFEQLRYAIQEANCQGVTDEVYQYLLDNYWDRFDNTLYSADTWRSDDATIATTAALDQRFQDEVNDTLTKAELAAASDVMPDDDVAVPTTGATKDYIDHVIETDILVDGTGLNKSGSGGQVTIGISAGSVDLDRIKAEDIITSAEANPNNDTTIATTAKIDDMIDAAITGDIASDGTGITVTDDGDGTITLGIAANSVDFDRIKNSDIITRAEQDAGTTEADTNIFTALAAAKRFDTLVQTSNPGLEGDWEVGKTWLQNDSNRALSIWNGTSWLTVSEGGGFVSQPNVVYVDKAAGDDAATGNRISTPKETIKAAIEQINSNIEIDVTADGFDGGSGYVDNTYSNVSLTHSSGTGIGTGLQATITVSGGAVTAISLSAAQQTTLEEYSIGDVLTASNADLGGSGSGLLIPITGEGDGQIVVVAAGVYQEIAPIQIKRRNVSIIGQALRSCIVHPTQATETNNLFELNSGSYLSSMTFTGIKAGTGTGNTLDATLPTTQGWNAAFYSGAFITKSPYIQNCTNFSDSEIDNSDLRAHRPRGGAAGDTDSAPTGGGLLVNGATPATSSPLRSMVCDSYTHVALNGPGILVVNNGYAQCTSSYAFFNKYHIKCLNGGQANLAASTTDFGDQALVADGRSTTAIFTAALSTAASDQDITFTIDAPTADASWHGSETRPQSNMLVELNSITYPILSATANGGGWDVTISRPDPNNRSNNLGLNGAVATPATASFFLRSQIASSGHTMEYVGSGTNYNALPENGGVPDEADQIVELNNGKVWTAITDHNGKFKIGGNQTTDPIFEVDQQLGFVTIPEGSIAFNLLSDQTPQLGGNLDVNGNEITSASNGNVVINPNGTGVISLDADVGIGTTNPGSADLAIVHPRDASNFARVSIGQNVDGQGSTDGNHLGLWYGNANSDRADIFTSAGNMNFWVDGAGDGTGQFTFGRTFNTEWMRIDDSGRLLVGTSTARAIGQSTSGHLQVEGTDNTALITITRNGNEAGGPVLALGKSRGTTVGSNTVVQSNDTLGLINFAGADGTDIQTVGARIGAQVDGTPGANDMPGRLVFSTNAGTTGATPTERMRISANGNITVDTDTFFVDAVNNRVGVGSTSPSSPLTVQTSGADLAIRTLLRLENTVSGGEGGNGVGSSIDFYDEHLTGNLVESARIASVVTDGGGTSRSASLTFWTTSTAVGPTGDDAIASERMRISGAGNLGIGTASPATTIHLRDAEPAIRFTADANNITQLQFGDTGDTVRGNIVFHNGTGGNALAFHTNNNNEHVRIDSSGRLLVGTSSERTIFDNTSSLVQIETSSNANRGISLTHNIDSAAGAFIQFAKTRGSGNALVSDDDYLGAIVFGGGDDTNIIKGAQISAQVDGTPGTDDMPGRLVFSTTADGESSPTERMRIQQNGNIAYYNLTSIVPASDNTVTLGASGYRWSAVWAANGTIQTSDERAKSDITTSALGSDFIKSLRPVSYKWVEGKKRDTGERDEDGNWIYESVPGERTHWGFIAQEVKQSVDAAGVDFGGWVLTDKDDPDSEQALRYDQFIAPLTKALQEAIAKIETLEQRLTDAGIA